MTNPKRLFSVFDLARGRAQRAALLILMTGYSPSILAQATGGLPVRLEGVQDVHFVLPADSPLHRLPSGPLLGCGARATYTYLDRAQAQASLTQFLTSQHLISMPTTPPGPAGTWTAAATGSVLLGAWRPQTATAGTLELCWRSFKVRKSYRRAGLSWESLLVIVVMFGLTALYRRL